VEEINSQKLGAATGERQSCGERKTTRAVAHLYSKGFLLKYNS